jgi:hypothetical protein
MYSHELQKPLYAKKTFRRPSLPSKKVLYIYRGSLIIKIIFFKEKKKSFFLIISHINENTKDAEI